MYHQTDVPVKFEDLTEEQVKEICNGCGGKGSWIRPPHGLFFKTSCDHHDYGYWKGCEDEDRLACDKKLRESMIEDCKRLPWYKKAIYRPWAELYYAGVRMKGDDFFYWGPVKRYPIPKEWSK